jgi:hypothetical protein
MTFVLFFISGVILAAGLFVWRFWFLRHRHPNTDLLIQALESISGPEDKQPATPQALPKSR